MSHGYAPDPADSEALSSSVAGNTGMLKAAARTWRLRMQAGQVDRSQLQEIWKHVSALEAAARLVEEGATVDTELRRAMETVRLSEERMRLMVEAVRDYAIIMLDPSGRIQSWNVGAERLKGYRAEEIIGQHVSIFYSEEDRQGGHAEEELKRAVADGRYEEEGWRYRKDGSRFWSNIVITPLFDHEGHHLGFTKVTRDFTERKNVEEKLRQSEERMRLMIEAVRDYAIFMLDPGGHIASWNSGAEAIKGYKADEVIGKHFSIFYTPEEAAAGRPERELRIATAEGRYEEEGIRVRKNGERFWANVVLSAIRDDSGTLRGFSKVTRDLTERRRIEQEARQAESQALLERTRAIEAQNAIQVRDEFISVAAHELRTPLAALQLKLQGMEQQLAKAGPTPGGEPAGRLATRLEGALRQTGRLSQLVDRLLDVSRIVSGKLVMEEEELDLAALVAQVVEDFREPAARAGSDLGLTSPSQVTGTWDRARLEQVVINLLSNAIKYGAGKPIAVELAATEAGVRLTVTDQGIGIPAESVERIFGRFERAVPIQHYGGLGLGLYVTRNIVEAHGGTIRVESVQGQGSTFTLDLPRSRA
jgi:PAS domain S-box-containing protein